MWAAGRDIEALGIVTSFFTQEKDAIFTMPIVTSIVQKINLHYFCNLHLRKSILPILFTSSSFFIKDLYNLAQNCFKRFGPRIRCVKSSTTRSTPGISYAYPPNLLVCFSQWSACNY